MNTITYFLDGYTTLTPDEKKTVLNDILTLKNPIGDLFLILKSEKATKQQKRQSINILCDIAKKPMQAKKIFRICTPAFSKDLLSLDDPKIRKAVARLCGIANKKEYNSPLIEAIEKEEIMYVLDSLILALGYTDYSKRSLDFLKNYKPKSTEEKHLKSEISAINKAKSSLAKADRLEKVKLGDMPVILTYCGELKDSLPSEMDEYGLSYSQTKILKNSLCVSPKNYNDVFGLRCFFEALIYLGEYSSYDEVKLLSEVLKKTDSLFNLDSYKFRLELKYLDPKEKKLTMESLIEKIEKFDKFSSSPSNYQFELRLNYNYGKVKAFISIPSFDDRFTYRKETIPASINPVVAASIMRAIKPYLSVDVRVLDPFCGTGTLLFERDYIAPCEELVGVDIKKDTIYKAKTNFLNSDVPISFLVSDILEADLNQTFDEVICNMPFGRRVSSHGDNISLYEGFIDLIDELLIKGGHAFLYTNEKELLRGLVIDNKNLSLLDEIIIESGGLFPSMFIIKRI